MLSNNNPPTARCGPRRNPAFDTATPAALGVAERRGSRYEAGRVGSERGIKACTFLGAGGAAPASLRQRELMGLLGFTSGIRDVTLKRSTWIHWEPDSVNDVQSERNIYAHLKSAHYFPNEL